MRFCRGDSETVPVEPPHSAHAYVEHTRPFVLVDVLVDVLGSRLLRRWSAEEGECFLVVWCAVLCVWCSYGTRLYYSGVIVFEPVKPLVVLWPLTHCRPGCPSLSLRCVVFT